jgi:bifunctional DNase/RNase
LQIPVKIAGLTIDPNTKTPIVILASEDKMLPIWIGGMEAHSILVQLQGIVSPRPLTHDLLKRVILSLSATVEKVIITEIREGTYFAEIIIKNGDISVAIDSRPSDAIALALRTNTQIYVEEAVLESAGSIMVEEESATPEEQKDRIRRYIENLKPEDFGDIEI